MLPTRDTVFMSIVALWGRAMSVGWYCECQKVEVLPSMALVPGLPVAVFALSTTMVQPAWDMAAAMTAAAAGAAGIAASATPS